MIIQLAELVNHLKTLISRLADMCTRLTDKCARLTGITPAGARTVPRDFGMSRVSGITQSVPYNPH